VHTLSILGKNYIIDYTNMKKLLTTLSLLPFFCFNAVNANTIAEAKSVEGFARVNIVCIQPQAIVTPNTNLCNPGGNATIPLHVKFSSTDSLEIVNKNHTIEWSTLSGGNRTVLSSSGFDIQVPYTVGTTIYSVRVIVPNFVGTPCYADLSISVSNPVTPLVLDVVGSETCGKDSINLNANAPLQGVETGTWSVIGASNNDISNTFIKNKNLHNSLFTGTPGVTYTLKWVLKNLGCSDSLTAKVLLNPNPKATVGGDITGKETCGLNSFNISGTAAANGIGEWKIVSGLNGSFSDIKNPNSTFSGDSGVAYKLRWIVSSDLCGKDSADLNLVFNLNPSNPDAGTSLNGFGTCGITNVPLQGIQPKVGTGTWSVVTGIGGTFVNVNDPVTTFTGKAEVDYVLAWTASNLPCDSRQDTMLVRFRENPSGDASFINPCGSSVATISGIASTGIGSWFIPIDGNDPIIGDVNLANTTLTGEVGKSYKVIWKVENSPCTAKFVELSVKLREEPKSPTINTTEICVGSSKVLDASTGENVIYNWAKKYKLPSGKDTIVVVNAFDLDKITVDYNDIVGDSNVYIVGVSNLDNCLNFDTALVVKVGDYNINLSSNFCNDKGSINLLKKLPFQIANGVYTWKDKDGNILYTSTSAADTSYTITSTGNYSLEVNEPRCGLKKFDFTINAYPQAQFKINALDSICLGTNLDVAANKIVDGTPKYKFYWYQKEANVNDTTLLLSDTLFIGSVKPNRDTTSLYLAVYDANGCVSRDTTFVHALNWDLKAPNIITPNNDSKNDQFKISKAPKTTVQIEFYNRWGEQLYKSDDYQNEWDGDNSPDGIYYYTMEPSCPQGAQKGWIQIVR
jgi:gliding motility-associated-like protein